MTDLKLDNNGIDYRLNGIDLICIEGLLEWFDIPTNLDLGNNYYNGGEVPEYLWLHLRKARGKILSGEIRISLNDGSDMVTFLKSNGVKKDVEIYTALRYRMEALVGNQGTVFMSVSYLNTACPTCGKAGYKS